MCYDNQDSRSPKVYIGHFPLVFPGDGKSVLTLDEEKLANKDVSDATI